MARKWSNFNLPGLSGFKLEAGTGSAFLTCKLAERPFCLSHAF